MPVIDQETLTVCLLALQVIWEYLTIINRIRSMSNGYRLTALEKKGASRSDRAFACEIARGIVAQLPDFNDQAADIVVTIRSFLGGCIKVYLDEREQMKWIDIQEGK